MHWGGGNLVFDHFHRTSTVMEQNWGNTLTYTPKVHTLDLWILCTIVINLSHKQWNIFIFLLQEINFFKRSANNHSLSSTQRVQLANTPCLHQTHPLHINYRNCLRCNSDSGWIRPVLQRKWNNLWCNVWSELMYF